MAPRPLPIQIIMRQRLAMLFKLLHIILIVFLLTLYVLASLPPVLALALYSATHLFRRIICSIVSSPALVFAALNASILLLSSSAHISPSPHVHSTHPSPYLLNASGLLGEIVVTAELENICDNAADQEEEEVEEEEQVVSTATDDVVDVDEVKTMIVTAVEYEADRNKCHRYSRSGLEIVDDDNGRSESESEPERCLEKLRAAAEVVAGVETIQMIEEREAVVEELSIAEFNRIIEAFLEKQKRFHYQENLSILV